MTFASKIVLIGTKIKLQLIDLTTINTSVRDHSSRYIEVKVDNFVVVLRLQMNTIVIIILKDSILL